MGRMIFIMGGQLHLSRGNSISGTWEKQGIIMGRMIFIMGGQLHLSRGNSISGTRGKSRGLLWAG